MPAIKDSSAYTAIGIISAILLGFIYWLIAIHQPAAVLPPWVTWLPALNATFNASSALSLCAGLWMIRRGRRTAHIYLMSQALVITTLFLLSYSIYHHFAGETHFGGQGWIRPLYFFILISHILLSAVVAPLAMTVVFFSMTGRFEKHKALARVTFPLWLYVSVSGVAVYFFLKPYHG